MNRMAWRWLLFVTRVLLIPLLGFDLLVGCKLILALLAGRATGVDGWIRHIALTGRPWVGTSMAQREVWVRQAYFCVFLFFALPIVLYFVQRRLKFKMQERTTAAVST